MEGLLVLGTGAMLASFHFLGTVQFAIERENKCVRGPARTWWLILKSLAFKPSLPADFFGFKFAKYFEVSSQLITVVLIT